MIFKQRVHSVDVRVRRIGIIQFNKYFKKIIQISSKYKHTHT